MRGNLGYGGRPGTAQTTGDTSGTARGFIAAGGTPPGTPSEFQFNDPVNSQNVGPMA